MKVYITEPDTINSQNVRDLLPANHQIIEGDITFQGEDREECSILIIRSATIIDDTIKTKFPKLAHIIRVGTGVDNIDTKFCKQHDIAIYNAPGANADAVSDYVVTMMFVALRKINQLTQPDLTSWNRFKFTGHSMSSRSIGIIGFGNIGKQIFTKLQGFNCKEFFVYDPFIEKKDLPIGVTFAPSVDVVLKKSDIITLHVPLVPSTHYLINKTNLNLLNDESILINASRGGIVNEQDVAECVSKNNIVYVADTVENEPSVSNDLLGSDNIIVTPHIASLTHESETTMLRFAIKNYLTRNPLKIL